MKAIVYTEYGSPDVLRLENLEKPTPNENEVLIKVHAASANPADWHLMRGEPFLARLTAGLFKPRHTRLGADVAGVIEAVGAKVTEFKVGDAVFGEMTLSHLGSFAEYVCATEDIIALKPKNVSFEEAATVPLAGHTALQGLRNFGKIRSGQTVLINGASGGVGTHAVQIAKSYGTEVTAVCSARNFELVRSIGADHVIDYNSADFCHNGQTYDLIYDAVGNRSAKDLQNALKPNGICVIAGFTNLKLLFQHMLYAKWISRNDSRKVGMMDTAYVHKPDLLMLREMLEQGKIRPVIDRCYPLEETAEAIRYLETGRARGKVVVTVP